MDHGIALYDVVVVGAGLSGLYAANKLKQENVTVLVLEGRDRISGRQWTFRDDRVGYADMGAAYVGLQQTKIMQVLKELDLETYSKVSCLDSIVCLKGLTMRYRPPIPFFRNPLVLLDMNNLLRLIDKLSLEVPIEEPWNHTKAAEWDQMTVQDFFEQHIWTKEVMALAKFCVSIPFVIEAHQMSFLYFLHEVRLCGGIVAVISVAGGLQERKIKGGSSQISTKLYENVKDNVILEELVKSVTQFSDRVEIKTEKGNVFRAKRVICCVPLPALHGVDFNPPLSSHMKDYVNVEPLGHTVKAFTFYKRRFWEDAGLSGEMVCEEGLTPWAIDDTKPDGSFPAIMAFISGEKAQEFAKLTAEERKKKLTESFAKVSGLKEFLHPVHYIDKHWQDKESTRFSRNCCVWSVPPRIITKHNRLPDLRFGNVYFAGTEFALTFRGYMDGALRSSEKVAAMVLESLGIDSYYDHREFHEAVPYCKRNVIETWLPDVPTFIGIMILLFITIIVMIFVAFAR